MLMAINNIYKAMVLYGYFIVSQSSFRWDMKTATVMYGQSATLSCNGNGCTPLSIRKWIGGPTNGVLCFNDYCSNQAKYQLMYNKSKPSFDLMIKRFNFTDANCTYTCACGFYQYTHMLQMDEIDFIYPLNKELTKTKQKDGKFYIEISMKVYPLPHCTIFYEKIVLPVDTKLLDVQTEVGLKLYKITLKYTLNVEYQNCGANLSLSCKVRSFEYHLLQQRLDLCKDHPNHPYVQSSNHVGAIFGIVSGVVAVIIVICVIRRRRKNNNRSFRN